MKFEANVGGIEGLCVFEPEVHDDSRGYFMESYNKEMFDYFVNEDINFVQDNESFSTCGVLRGLHYQKQHPQGKLVRVIEGEVFDVAVDIRRDSPTFGRWYGVCLSGVNKKQLWIPAGFAHGFLVTSDVARFAYKCTDFYYPDDQYGILWNDPDIGIEWPRIAYPNSRDAAWPRLNEIG